MSNPGMDGEGFEQLAEDVRGAVVLPEHRAYEQARRVWNGMVDKHPGAVVQATCEEDVATTVRFAAENDLLLAVRGGGHSVAGQGTCDGGLVLDLGRINQVSVDPLAGIVSAGGGCLLGDIDRECQAHGMVVPAGVVSHTGAGGLTLGGGVGWLTRRFGLTCDNVASFRITLASGESVTVGEDHLPELYWGLRGGGGNFGVVTEFRYRCHPFPTEIPVGIGYWPLADAEGILRAHAERMPERPEEWKATTFLLRPTADSGVPAELIGKPCLMIVQIWAGSDLAAAEREFATYFQVARPAIGSVQPMNFLSLQSIEDDAAGHSQGNYTKGGYIDGGLSDAAIAALLASVEEMQNDLSMIEVIPHGGAQLRLGDDDTAFPDRASLYSFNVFARWPLEEDEEPHIAWARRSHQRLEDYAGSGVYVNFLNPHDGVDQERVRAAFGRRHYDKLAGLKAEYDPGNLFSLNPNVKPPIAS